MCMDILGAIAEFERGRLRERVLAGLQRARTEGRTLGRPRRRIPTDRIEAVRGLTVRQTAARLGVSRSTAQRWIHHSAPGPAYDDPLGVSP